MKANKTQVEYPRGYKTFIPFMKKLYQKYPVKRVDVDSGYESEENYHYLDGCKQLPLFVKTSNHEQKRKGSTKRILSIEKIYPMMQKRTSIPVLRGKH